ncbi:MAG: hypothetical protein GY953_12390 [bacterium]|nr:hypothetical protein [bacterium]
MTQDSVRRGSIQHATKGKPLPDDDSRLRAMEAYILAQQEGKAIAPGKH